MIRYIIVVLTIGFVFLSGCGSLYYSDPPGHASAPSYYCYSGGGQNKYTRCIPQGGDKDNPSAPPYYCYSNGSYTRCYPTKY